MTEVSPKITSDFLYGKLRQEGVLLLDEVRDAGGHYANRSLDAMAFGLWPSKGSHATGYEIKISRSDWQNEMKQIEKAEAFRPFCKYFFLVANKKVAELHEIPETWGFLEWDGRRLVTVKQAPENKDLLPFPPKMLSAILKRASERSFDLAFVGARKQYEEREANLEKIIAERVDYEMKHARSDLENAQKLMTALGMKRCFMSSYEIDSFISNNPQAIELIKDVMTFEGKNWGSRYTKISQRMQFYLDDLKGLEATRELAEGILVKAKQFDDRGKHDDANNNS